MGALSPSEKPELSRFRGCQISAPTAQQRGIFLQHCCSHSPVPQQLAGSITSNAVPARYRSRYLSCGPISDAQDPWIQRHGQRRPRRPPVALRRAPLRLVHQLPMRRSTQGCRAELSPATTFDGCRICEWLEGGGRARCKGSGHRLKMTTSNSRTSCFTRDCYRASRSASPCDSSCPSCLGEYT